MEAEGLKTISTADYLFAKRTKIVKELEDSRAKIRKTSNEIANLTVDAANLKTKLSYVKAEATVTAATRINEETGKAFYPNENAQKAAADVALRDNSDYQADLKKLRELEKKIAIRTNEVACERDHQTDVSTEVDLLTLEFGSAQS